MLTLHKSSQHLAPRLQQGVPDNDLEELLQPRSPILDDLVTEPVGKHFAGKWRDSHSGALAFQNIAEVFKIRIPSPHRRLAQLEGWNIGAADDFVVGVHVPTDTMCLWVAHLLMS